MFNLCASCYKEELEKGAFRNNYFRIDGCEHDADAVHLTSCHDCGERKIRGV